MSGLKKDLGLWQGMGLLATSLLGTGIFVVPATAASLAGGASLWAWLLLIALVLPIAFTFARLGRRYPHAGGAPHLIGLAFGNGAERFSAFLFLAVLPVGLPAALMIAAGFWHALFEMGEWTLWAIQPADPARGLSAGAARGALLRQPATADCARHFGAHPAYLVQGGGELARCGPAAAERG